MTRVLLRARAWCRLTVECSAGRGAARPGHRALLASDPRRAMGAAWPGFGAPGPALRPAQHGEAQHSMPRAAADRHSGAAAAARLQDGEGPKRGSPVRRGGGAGASEVAGSHGMSRVAAGAAATTPAMGGRPAVPRGGRPGAASAAAAQQFAPVVSFARWRLEEPPKKPSKSRSARSQARRPLCRQDMLPWLSHPHAVEMPLPCLIVVCAAPGCCRDSESCLAMLPCSLIIVMATLLAKGHTMSQQGSLM